MASEPTLENWLGKALPDPADQREYIRHRLVIAMGEAIAEAMEQKGLRRVDIAKRLGVGKSFISQVLGGRRNVTLRTLASIMWACDMDLECIRLEPLAVAPPAAGGET